MITIPDDSTRAALVVCMDLAVITLWHATFPPPASARSVADALRTKVRAITTTFQ
jgi:hypothetical protein